MQGVATMFIMALSFFFLYTKELRLQRVTGYILLFWSFLLLKELLFIYPYFYTSSYWQPVRYHLDMCAVPCCAFFLAEFARPSYVTFRVVLLNELPYLLTGGFFLITGNPITLQIIGIYSLVYGVAVTFWNVGFIKRYNRMIKANYSNIDYLNVKWLWKAVGIFFFFLVIWLITCFYDNCWLDAIYYFWTCVLWGLICYYINRQTVPSAEACTSMKAASLVSDSSLSEAYYSFVPELERQLMKECVYLNPLLTISDLSLLVGTNRTYLSDYLNNYLHVAFYDYINGYRLDESVKYLTASEEEWISIEEVAVKCGFNSPSTFRRAFQRVYGCSPNEYRKTH